MSLRITAESGGHGPRGGLSGDPDTSSFRPEVVRTLVDQTAFRGAMGAIATPVSVVTAFSGEPHGTTVSAFCSLSLAPPMVLVSLQHNSELLEVVRAAGRFGLNVLSAEQAEVAGVFATRGIDRFSEVDWRMDGRLPRLAGTAAWAACDVAGLSSAGDHVIVTGYVERAEHSDLRGLTYQHRKFGTFTAATESTARH